MTLPTGDALEYNTGAHLGKSTVADALEYTVATAAGAVTGARDADTGGILVPVPLARVAAFRGKDLHMPEPTQ